MPRASTFTNRTIIAPIACLTMASLLFVYARSSIYAAKRNAQSHRESDGGQISWKNENARRHGRMERPESVSVGKWLFGGGKQDGVMGKEMERDEGEEKVRRRRRGGEGG